MPLNVRSISVSIAVICFFGIAVTGWINRLSSFACCKRALAAAIIMYIATSLAVKIINAILISAMINNRMNQQKEAANDSGD
jgi:hypothetical protein